VDILAESVAIWVRIGIFLGRNLKNHLISVQPSLVSKQKGGGRKIETRTMALTLVLLTALAAIFGGLALTAFAAETETKTTEMGTSLAADAGSQTQDIPLDGMPEMIMGHQGFGRRHGGAGGMGNIEVSSEYTETVNTILENDADVQNLIAEGYKITSIRPVIKNVVEADGTLSAKATAAIVTLQDGASRYAVASVDITDAKVTQIVIITRTVIDKTAS